LKSTLYAKNLSITLWRREAYAADSGLPEALHAKALELYKTYLVVGGMPGAVWAYLKERHMLDAVSVQNLILSSYVADMSKYASPAETTSGAIAENYTAVSLKAKGYPLYYWESGGTAEIDFILQRGEEVIPVEVKTGIHTKSRSLAVYRERYAPAHAVRISQKNFGLENGIKSIPLYAVFCM